MSVDVKKSPEVPLENLNLSTDEMALKNEIESLLKYIQYKKKNNFVILIFSLERILRLMN